MEDDLNILLWAFGGAGESYWGPGISAYNMYNTSLQQGLKLHVDLAHGFAGQREYEVFDNVHLIAALRGMVRSGSPLTEKQLQLINRYYAKIVNEPMFLLQSRRWLKRNFHRYDVAHCLSTFHVSFFPALWLERLGKPAFLKVTSEDPMPVESVFSKVFGLHSTRRKTINEISGYIAVSKEIRDSLSNFGIEDTKIHLIGNGVNTGRFAPIDTSSKGVFRKNLKLKSEVVFIFTGAITERKSPSTIVRACVTLKEQGFNFHLLLVGPTRGGDNESHTIKDLIRLNHLESYVTMLDFTVEIEMLYQIADVFVLPSKKEGMSNSLLEAMSTGLPAIVTRVSGMSDLVFEGKNGFYMSDDYRDLARIMELYLTKPNMLQEHGRRAREHIVQCFSDKSVLQQHCALFHRYKQPR